MKYRLGLLLFCFTISGLTLGGCAALKKGRKVEESPDARLEKILLGEPWNMNETINPTRPCSPMRRLWQ